MPDLKPFMIRGPMVARFTAVTPATAPVQPAVSAGPSIKPVKTALLVDPIRPYSKTVPTSRLSPTVRVETVRLLNPNLADLISRVRVPPAGVPRNQITAPISPVENVTDQALFEDAADATGKFFLPRYRLVVQNGQFQVFLAQSGQDWSLTVHLEKYPAPEIEQKSQGSKEIDHSITVMLAHRLMVGGSSAGQKELVFQEVTAAGSVIKAVLRVGTLLERDRLYQAMTDSAYAASLIVRRAFRVGIPVPASATPSRISDASVRKMAAGRVWVRPTDVASSAAKTVQPSRSFSTVPPAQQPSLFREVTRTLDQAVEPTPYVFLPNLHGYIFGGIAPSSGQSFRLIRRQIESNSYYQDPAHPSLFYYLPDSFKIARIPQSPHLPFMMARFSAPENDLSPEHIQATLNYAAIPYVDPNRLEADSDKLRQRHLTGQRTPGADIPVFEPLLVGPEGIRFLLSLPRTDSSSGPYEERKGASVDLRTGIHDILTLSIKDFQAIYEAMFSPVALLFNGRIEVEIGDGPDKQGEVIPFESRMNDLAGDLFDYREIPDAPSGGVRAFFKNAIESPLQINRLQAVLRRGENKLSAHIEGVSFDAPIRLSPQEEIEFVVAPDVKTEGDEPLNALFDLEGVDVLPDREAIWNAILDPSTSEYARMIHVQTFKEIFDPPPDRPQDRILEIDVDLRRGSGQTVTARLRAEEPMVDVRLPIPVSDYVLEREDKGQYSYCVTVIRQDHAKEGAWKTASRDTLWVLSSEVN